MHVNVFLNCTLYPETPVAPLSDPFCVVNAFILVFCSFQALPYVALLIVMMFFIYAVIGMQVRFVT